MHWSCTTSEEGSTSCPNLKNLILSSVLLCQSVHTSQKRKKERQPTDFGLVQRLLEGVHSFFVEDEKDAFTSPSLPTKVYLKGPTQGLLATAVSMLPTKNRLKREDFNTLKGGKRTVTEHFSCTSYPSPLLKVAVVISKKVAKRAVDRHLLKRRIHSVIHKKSPPAGVYNIYARKNSPTLTYAHIEEEIATLLRL